MPRQGFSPALHLQRGASVAPFRMTKPDMTIAMMTDKGKLVLFYTFVV